jgi:class 3 adenylate cyclase
MDVVVWLRSLGLGKYEAAFRENEIDETVLPSLTAEDLQVLGVTALGHRRKLLDAIAVLRAGTHATPAATPGLAAADASPRDTAERRQVTVMFSDLVGSTALSARMDPEDCISGIRRLTRTMPSGLCAQGWSWSRQSMI